MQTAETSGKSIGIGFLRQGSISLDSFCSTEVATQTCTQRLGKLYCAI